MVAHTCLLLGGIIHSDIMFSCCPFSVVSEFSSFAFSSTSSSFWTSAPLLEGKSQELRRLAADDEKDEGVEDEEVFSAAAAAAIPGVSFTPLLSYSGSSSKVGPPSEALAVSSNSKRCAAVAAMHFIFFQAMVFCTLNNFTLSRLHSFSKWEIVGGPSVLSPRIPYISFLPPRIPRLVFATGGQRRRRKGLELEAMRRKRRNLEEGEEVSFFCRDLFSEQLVVLLLFLPPSSPFP